MRSLVRGFRTVARGGGSGAGANKVAAAKKRTTWDIVLWVLILGAGVYVALKLANKI